MTETTVATIDTGRHIYEICTTGVSYRVAGLTVTDGRGRIRSVRGCHNVRAAFADAKHLARMVNKRKPDTFTCPSGWTFRRVES